MLPGFPCRDFVAVLIKYDEDVAERRLVLYLPYNSKDHPLVKEMRNSRDILKIKTST